MPCLNYCAISAITHTSVRDEKLKKEKGSSNYTKTLGQTSSQGQLDTTVLTE